MHQRSELEQPRTLAKMKAVIDTFANDNAQYSNTEVRRRTGVAKIVIEEYLPLFLLAQSLPGFKSAYLTPDSHPGPDAVLLFNDGSHATVQITCAGEDESTALQRQLLDDAQLVFANQSFRRNRITRKINQSGRVLTTRAVNTSTLIFEVLSALRRKTHQYRAGTQFLLISIRRPEITMTKDWQQQVCGAVTALMDLSYEHIYVSTAHICFVCVPRA